MTKRLLDLILIATTTIASFGQTFDSKKICDRIVEIDTTEFKSNFVKSDMALSTNSLFKTDGKLTIKTKDSAYTFIDNNGGDYGPLYKIVSEDVDKNWIWIEEQDLHTARHFLINTKTSRIDTLIGPASIFGDKIVSLEDGYTDSPRIVEIYKIKNDKIVLLRKFPLKPCLCCIRTIYLKGKTIFLADNWDKKYRAWKIRVL
jgi:hypothetical protein